MRFFIDSINGDDETGDGSRRYPFKTLKECTDTNRFTEETTIFLASGTYELYGTLFSSTSANVRTTVIGVGLNTTVSVIQSSNYYTGGHASSIITFKRLKFINTNMPYQHMAISRDWRRTYYFPVISKLEFYNIYFILNKIGCYKMYSTGNIYYDLSNSVAEDYRSIAYYCFFQNNNTTYFKNCISNGNHRMICSNKITLEDSYGYFSLYSTTGCIIDNTVITSTLSLDSKLEITNQELIDRGLGLYRGRYPWIFANFLVWMNSKYYSPQPKFYDSNAKMYKEISKSDISINGIDEYLVSDFYDFTRVKYEVEGEVFYPIDKFDNFRLIAMNLNYIYANGIKSNYELIVQTFDLNPTSVKQINNVLVSASITNDSDIKFVFSQDTGETWQTFENDTLTFTDCVIPRKSYDDMSQMEKDSFNTALETIKEKGITLADFQKIDFNSLNLQRLRFAYVINRNNYLSTSNITEISWNYEDKDYLRELRDSEYVTDVFEHVLKIKSNITNPKLVIQMIL